MGTIGGGVVVGSPSSGYNRGEWGETHQVGTIGGGSGGVSSSGGYNRGEWGSSSGGYNRGEWEELIRWVQ